MKQKALIIIFVFVLLISTLIIHKNNKDSKYKTLNKDNVLAIYIDGVESTSIPTKNSGYEFDRAECNNGTTVNWDYDNWALDMSFSSKTKCNLYFKNSFKIRGTATNILSQFTEDNTSLSVIDKGWTNTFGYDLTADNNLRYVGADPKNYVQFNGELWRIIGVMNNVENASGQNQTLLKIIRANHIGKYCWDTSNTSIANGQGGINQWGESTYDDGTPYEGADLMRELNTDYLGNITVGTDGKWYNGKNDKKEADMPPNLINADSKAMIESVVWYLGVPGADNGKVNRSAEKNVTAQLSYQIERSDTNGKICGYSSYYTTPCQDNVERISTWTGKVALFYPSDYGFATSGGNIEDRETCLNASIASNVSTAVDGWDKHSDCTDNSWFFDGTVQWMLTPGVYSYSSVQRLERGGYARDGASASYNIKPVLYLKSNVSVIGGSGAKFDPYILSNTTTT